MVFQDGSSYAARDESWRVTIVLNNLIVRKELPVMAAVFVDPGDHWPLIRDGSNRSVVRHLERRLCELFVGGDLSRSPHARPNQALAGKGYVLDENGVAVESG